MKSNYKNYNKIKSPNSQLGQKSINDSKHARYQQTSSCQLQYKVNITKEELYELYKQEASKVKSLSAINNALVQSVQNIQRQTQQRVQTIRSNYKSSIQHLRYSYSDQIRLYSNKICLFQQQIQNLNAKIHQLKAQSHNKTQKIASLEKVIDLLLENKTSTKNQIKQKVQEQDSNVMPNNININQITQLAAELNKTQDHLNKTMCNYKQLDQKNGLLQSELSQKSHQLLVNNKLTDSLKTQVDYFKQQNQELNQKIKNYLKNKKELQEKLVKMEKEYQMKHQAKYLELVNKINILNKKINELEKINQKLINELENNKQKISESNNSLVLAVQKARWYEKLLNQAKQNFIYSQLKKQDQVNNMKRQNKQLKIELSKMKRKTQHTRSLLYSQNDMNFINGSRKSQNDLKLQKTYEQFNQQKRQIL